MGWQQLTAEQRQEVRRVTCEKLPAFCKSLRDSLPDADIEILYPLERELASTIYVSLKHIKGENRALDFTAGGVGLLANLTDNEKNRIGEAVGKAASETTLEAWMKPKACAPSTLVYRVFHKIG